MNLINLTASSQTFACESCGHVNVVPASLSHTQEGTNQKAATSEPHAQQGLLEQADLPASLGKEPSTVSKLAADLTDLSALAAANAASDGKLVQHVEELHQHQASHPPHHTIQRRASHLNPTLSGSHSLSHLRRSSSGATDLSPHQGLSSRHHPSQTAAQHSDHAALEEADLPHSLAKQPSAVSRHIAEADDLNGLAAANAAHDGRLEQHLQELHVLHPGHAMHSTPSRRASRLNPSLSGAFALGTLSRGSSDALELAPDTLPQQSGPAQPRPPSSLVADQLTEGLQRTASGSTASAVPSRSPSAFPNLGTLSDHGLHSFMTLTVCPVHESEKKCPCHLPAL